jgi:hypothetical protein
MLVALFLVSNISVESFPRPGSAYENLRLTETTQLPPEVVAEAMWGTGTRDDVTSNHVTEYRMLESQPTVRFVYQVISAPAIADRDYVMRVERYQEGETRVVKMRTVEDARAPHRPGKVRMEVIGQATVTPNGSGSKIVYDLWTDLRGDLPPWMAKAAQREAAVSWLRGMLQKGQKIAHLRVVHASR